MFFSEYLSLSPRQLNKMNSMDVFDPILEKDSNFFINIICLKNTTIPEFKIAYGSVNEFFKEIAMLLDAADSVGDVFYRKVRKKFSFHEVNGINLGFSLSKHGAGWGKSISERFLNDAYKIVKKGSKQPELFHLVSLFEDDVAGDRLSDMIATIIEPQIKQYTLRVMDELGINPENSGDILFMADGLIKNPYKKAPILLLPKSILHELPIAREWDDVDRVIEENESIRQELSEEIGDNWSRWATSDKKDFLKEHIFMNPDVCERVIEGYKKQKVEEFDVRSDLDYFSELILKKVKESISFKSKSNEINSYDAMIEVINIFKDWVENNRGWDIIQRSPNRNKEKIIQRLIHLSAKHYVDINGFDISCEADEGRGPVDFKLSKGDDKTIVEVKLSSSNQYLHGYEIQLKEYATAEKTQNMIYLLVDLGNPRRIENILRIHEENKKNNIQCPMLIIVDAKNKQSASIYEE